MRRRLLLLRCATWLGFILAATASRADYLEQTLRIAPDTPTSYGVGLAFDRFDPGRGTLTSVEIHAGIPDDPFQFETVVQLNNQGDQPATFSIRSETRLSIGLGPLGEPVSLLNVSFRENAWINQTFALTVSRFNLAPGATWTGTGSVSQPPAVYILDSQDEAFGAFLGAGTIADLNLLAYNIGVVSVTGSQVIHNQVTSGGGSIRLIYHYSSVAEPGAWMLTGLGLGVGGAVGRLRRKPRSP